MSGGAAPVRKALEAICRKLRSIPIHKPPSGRPIGLLRALGPIPGMPGISGLPGGVPGLPGIPSPLALGGGAGAGAGPLAGGAIPLLRAPGPGGAEVTYRLLCPDSRIGACFSPRTRHLHRPTRNSPHFSVQRRLPVPGTAVPTR